MNQLNRLKPFDRELDIPWEVLTNFLFDRYQKTEQALIVAFVCKLDAFRHRKLLCLESRTQKDRPATSIFSPETRRCP